MKRSAFQWIAAGHLALLLAAASSAATFVVTKTSDDNGPCDPLDCSLREAVLAANAAPGSDVIEVPAGVHTLSIPGYDDTAMLGDLDIVGDLEIHGSRTGSAVVQSTVPDRIFAIQGPLGAPYVVRFLDLVISGADGRGGGGIYGASADLTMERSAVVANQASETGAGIFFGIGRLALLHSLVADNQAIIGAGGGLGVFCPPNAPCEVLIENSTISGNSASKGSAIWTSGAVTLQIKDATIANNPGSSAIFTEFDVPSVRITRSLIEGLCAWLTPLSSASGGNNLEGPGSTCRLDQASDQTGIADLGLEPLADNGGPTLTHALRLDSPAIAAGGTGCAPNDQRGVPRPQDGDLDGTPLCDVGAFEAIAGIPAVEVPGLGLEARGILAALCVLAGLALLRRKG